MSIGFTLEDLPEKLASNKEKEKFIKKEIKKAVNEFNLNGKSSTELEYRIGSMFNVLKKVVKKDGDEWETYLEEKFPYLNIRKVQRYMRLAKKFDLDKYPKLSFAGQTRLLALVQFIPKDQEAPGFLNNAGIDLDFDRKDPLAVVDFNTQIDELIKKMKKENPTGKKPPKPSVNVSLNRITEAAKKCNKTLKQAKNDEKLLKPVERDSLDQTIEQIESLLKQLKKIRKRMSGKDNEKPKEE